MSIASILLFAGLLTAEPAPGQATTPPPTAPGDEPGSEAPPPQQRRAEPAPRPPAPEFTPSERIEADQSVAFPVDI
jgi:hypothetical protein